MGGFPSKSVRGEHYQHNPNSIKVHATISKSYSLDTNKEIKTLLGDATDEELLAEIARRKINIRTRITDSVVKETYEYGPILGRGASGTVQEVVHRKTRKKFALKIIHKDDEINDMESMMMEIEIMKRVRHRYVISMYELFETANTLWMVMQLYSGGSMHDYLMKVPNYSESLAALHTSQMLEGLHYMHSLGIIHRDLKLDNILMHDVGEGQMEVKIADFGLSCILPLGEDGYDANHSVKRKKFDKCDDMWGTREYFAPELIATAYGPQADLWSLGCVVYEMLVGLPAFSLKRCGNNENNLYALISRGGYDTTCPEWCRVSQNGRRFLQDLLTVKPTKRLCCEEALEHVWIREQLQSGEGKSAAVDNALAENTKAYRENFGESRRVRRKGERLNKMRAAVNAMASARKFTASASGASVGVGSGSQETPHSTIPEEKQENE